LKTNAFGTPEIVATGWRGAECFTVTRAVPGGLNLIGYVRKLRSRGDPSAQRALQIAAEELGRVVGRMHARGIVHGDLRWGNVLVVGSLENPRFVFLDNERTVQHRRASRRQILKNLVQLNLVPDNWLSRTERMRFWRAYRAEHQGLQGKPKHWIRLVIARTSRRWTRRARKDRAVRSTSKVAAQ
jgi:Ser/Thr protein kinase RdoA (MazF antagonist)